MAAGADRGQYLAALWKRPRKEDKGTGTGRADMADTAHMAETAAAPGTVEMEDKVDSAAWTSSSPLYDFARSGDCGRS
jgi:hypothetical protein